MSTIAWSVTTSIKNKTTVNVKADAKELEAIGLLLIGPRSWSDKESKNHPIVTI